MELALILPVVVIVVLAVFQVLVVARDAASLTAATRSAARAAIVGAEGDELRSAALRERRLVPTRLVVTRSGGSVSGELTSVSATYRAPTNVPIVGRLVGDITLQERFVVQVE
ncbi:MAG: hypothetical protein GX868_02655 [Actinobacteria bacterium]|nr:hypothetical protein [Actinomycetota bacterium]